MPQTAHYAYMNDKRHPTDRDAAHASDQETTVPSLHITPRQLGTTGQAKHGPDRGPDRNLRMHTDKKSGCRGNSPAPACMPDSTAPERKCTKGLRGPRGETGRNRRSVRPAWGHVLKVQFFLEGFRKNWTPTNTYRKLSRTTPDAGKGSSGRQVAE